jgi:hypothetical protein
MACLQAFEKQFTSLIGFKILVMITRRIEGCFVSDMIQQQKYNAIRTCAQKALAKLNKYAFASHIARKGDQVNGSVDNQLSKTNQPSRFKRNILPTPAIRMDANSISIPHPRDTTKKKERPGHFLDS